MLGLAHDRILMYHGTPAADLFAVPLEQRVVDQVRTAINTDCALGSERFMQEAEALLGRSVRPPHRGRPRKDVTEKLL